MAQLFETDSVFYKTNDLGDSFYHQFMDLESVFLLGSFMTNASEVLETHNLFVQNLMQNFPNILISQHSILLNKLDQLKHKVQQYLLRFEKIVSYPKLFVFQCHIDTLHHHEKLVVTYSGIFGVFELEVEAEDYCCV